MTKNEFKERWEALFEFINLRKKIARSYTLIYISRRLIFLILCFYKNDNEGLILLINLFVNLIYGIYMASAKAFLKKGLNKMDLINEIAIAVTLYWKILYTGLVYS